MYAFLGLNGLRVDAPEPDVVPIMLAVASSDIEETEVASWLRENTFSRYLYPCGSTISGRG